MPAARAAEIVGERRTVAVAGHRAQPAQRACPDAPRARAVARLDLAGLRQRLALAAAALPPRANAICWPTRVHEQRRALDVGRAEVGILLAADGVQRRRSLLGAEPAQRVQHGVEVARRRGVDLVEHRADGILVGRLRAGGEGARRLEQQQIDVVGVVRQRRRQEGEVAGHARVGAAEAAGGVEDRVGRVARVAARLRPAPGPCRRSGSRCRRR